MENQDETTAQEVAWRIYERYVASLLSDEWISESISVTPNAKLIGSISGIERQIDVLVDTRWSTDTSQRIIVDAKHYREKVDIKDVEMFEGMMRDCKAQHGIIVCPKGHTNGALRRAQESITIRLFEPESFERFDPLWRNFCHGHCWKKKKNKRGLVFWDRPWELIVNGSQCLFASGKCDLCADFHLWCFTCDEKFVLRSKKDDDHHCSCGKHWLTSIENEEEGNSHTVNQTVCLMMVLPLRLFPHNLDEQLALVCPIERRRLS